mmetsp:Transcript_26278/g.66710  ORF Transcript_26278/g.66710 Transcript_26278/m.66710 type:complete len:201 (-) Transcript_26278:29-631(-)
MNSCAAGVSWPLAVSKCLSCSVSRKPLGRGGSGAFSSCSVHCASRKWVRMRPANCGSPPSAAPNVQPRCAEQRAHEAIRHANGGKKECSSVGVPESSSLAQAATPKRHTSKRRDCALVALYTHASSLPRRSSWYGYEALSSRAICSGRRSAAAAIGWLHRAQRITAVRSCTGASSPASSEVRSSTGASCRGKSSSGTHMS